MNSARLETDDGSGNDDKQNSHKETFSSFFFSSSSLSFFFFFVFLFLCLYVSFFRTCASWVSLEVEVPQALGLRRGVLQHGCSAVQGNGTGLPVARALLARARVLTTRTAQRPQMHTTRARMCPQSTTRIQTTRSHNTQTAQTPPREELGMLRSIRSSDWDSRSATSPWCVNVRGITLRCGKSCRRMATRGLRIKLAHCPGHANTIDAPTHTTHTHARPVNR